MKGSGKIDRLVIFYAVADPIYADWFHAAPVCIYRKGLPSSEELEDESLLKKDQNTLLIVDDLDSHEDSEIIHK